MMFSFVLFSFDPILNGFLRFWKNPEIQDGVPRWPPFTYYDVMITSCDVIPHDAGHKGNTFVLTVYPPSFVVITLILPQLRGRGEGRFKSPTIVEGQKNPA